MMNRTKQIVLTAMFIAIGVILPQAFHAIPNAGSIFLPMHIPVLVSGFVVGPLFGC
ncbi:MAG: ECF transporter S component, partial [Erysipelotrichaceae bacterium]|nr:ECF transporter S component [Erysipelotrichaceae bacterium]